MEFPHLGKHCSKNTCNKLDFLPMKCDACNEIYCSEHVSYVQHSCSAAYKNDVQVPVCPLCEEPVPTPRGVPPDRTVGQHIDQFCRSQQRKIFTNACSYKNCKKKELVPFQCSICKMNFCLKHRHCTDHACKGSREAQRNFNTADTTTQNSPDVNAMVSNKVETIQGNMTEDEALAKALALSIMELDESSEQNRRNQRPPIRVGGTSNLSENKDKCCLS